MLDTIKNVILTSGKMVREVEHPDKIQYVLCHNGKDVYHFIVVDPSNTCTTGQPFMETFENKELLLARMQTLEMTDEKREDLDAFIFGDKEQAVIQGVDTNFSENEVKNGIP